MQIHFYCPYWGSENLPFNLFLKMVKDAGYTGVEMSLPSDQLQKRDIINQLEKFDLSLIAQHWETIDEEFNIHKINYEKRLRNLCEAGPVFINSQTGKDYFHFDENADLIELAGKISKETGIKIIHETHRGKFSFAPHVTRVFLEKIPDLKITLDISHWFNVAESTLEDQTGTLLLAVKQTDHIHARVGFNEGPQVNDPRAPEWKEFVELHLKWWDQVILNQINKGEKVFTITTEFGPAPYMPLLPYSKQPVASQWDVNLYMMNLLNDRYSNK